ncbi:hypothetical protein GQ55_3G428200 [Panicum hallii var. hallii]|jgi:hypothetical protein|uniref:Rapid alkalinization factor-like n=3 Tax=Panicum sect. Panicum TaxID=2100772 RepID=A0A3L6RDH7_PANMI|nr:rapid alkalinization factor-like [Panicum hallii]PUZ67353.1 hypothetical protein GQ55_3G428200 [Panicum hallii var. hallii]PVH63012.1 hypothetical protein PAHAL_3G453900 [Panicum hallii]RLN00877.1 rapid alkalinization factor-like [Panicum miliaceum]
MAKLALALLLLLAVAATASAAASIDLDLGFLSSGGAGAGARRECRGTVAECLAEDEEAELGSASAESHRRALAGRGYISYGALRRDNVPCSRRGASYYNCRPGAQANPYHRGCSRITRCRG